MLIRTVSLLLASSTAFAANLTLLQAYQGTTFFDRWDFDTDADITTNGDVQFVSPVLNSSYSKLAFVTGDGTAVVSVDNTSLVDFNQKRNSIRMTSKDFYEVGTVWVFDAFHLPYGCAVWPAFWTKGLDWPRQGEIDIMEGINLQSTNQMALHTYAGCQVDSNTDHTGLIGVTNCNDTSMSGCTVTENNKNSYGAGFAQAGGGVFATQFDVAGIFIWFWSRPDVPQSVSTATDSIDISSWGPPSAVYASSSCDIGSHFSAQQLVLDITLCGSWAGVPSIYVPQCGGNITMNNTCYLNSVINNDDHPVPHFENAYFEIQYIKAFGVNSSVKIDPSQVNSSSGGAGGSSTQGSPSPTGSPGGSGGSSSDGLTLRAVVSSLVGAGLMAMVALVIS